MSGVDRAGLCPEVAGLSPLILLLRARAQRAPRPLLFLLLLLPQRLLLLLLNGTQASTEPFRSGGKAGAEGAAKTQNEPRKQGGGNIVSDLLTRPRSGRNRPTVSVEEHQFLVSKEIY